jgi:DNA-directed RNA polymerase sigma subunit (sigma70/sigma32)
MEPTPEAVVERSLLRQCLENALAIELSPHERDVIRLRHGLDDGVSRTLREVLESCGGTLTPADIRRAEYRAYNKLRMPRSVHNQRLMGFAHELSSLE